MEGRDVSGDAFVCEHFRGGAVVAAIDGLGRGAEAGKVAAMAKGIIIENAVELLEGMVRLCREGLKHARGVAASIARCDASRNNMQWLGVGNVEGFIYENDNESPGSKQALIAGNGIIAYDLPSIEAATIAIRPGDTLAMFTNGIPSRISGDLDASREPREIAERVLGDYSKASDDAQVVVARCLGGEP